jgi:predicted solute-binding protein
MKCLAGRQIAVEVDVGSLAVEAEMKIMAIRSALFATLVGTYMLSPVAGVLGLASGVVYIVWQSRRPLDAQS